MRDPSQKSIGPICFLVRECVGGEWNDEEYTCLWDGSKEFCRGELMTEMAVPVWKRRYRRQSYLCVCVG